MPRWSPYIVSIALLNAPLAMPAEAPRLNFEQISVAQGLSQSIVPRIIQDRRGFLWFASEDGLNLFDGYGFTVLRSDPQDPASLSYNQVTDIYEDRGGIIWIGTFNGGLNRYVLKKDRFVHYRHDPGNALSLSNDIIHCIVQDSREALWIGTEEGLNQMMPFREGDPVVFIRYYHDRKDPHSLSNNQVRAIARDSSGALWIGTNAGVNYLTVEEATRDRPHFLHFRHHPESLNSLSHDTVRTIYVDRKGSVWIGTVQGLNRFIPGHPGTFKTYHHDPRDPTSISNDHIYALLEDTAGYLWIGTDGGGLNRFDPATETFTAFRHNAQNANSLSHDEIRSLFQDRSGLMWVGTYGGGVNKVDAEKKRFALYCHDPQNPNSLSAPIIWTICEDTRGILWIGTHGGGLNRLDRKTNRYTHYRADPSNPHSLSHDIVRLVTPDPGGDLWIGTHGGGICRFNPESGRFIRFLHDPDDPASLSHNEIRAFYLDEKGLLWIGTYGGGLEQLDTRAAGKPVFKHFRHDPKKPDGLSNDYIRAIFKDHTGAIWIATQGGGLNLFNPERETFTHFRFNRNATGSISSDYVFCIQEDHEGVLWLGTWGAGLNRYDRRTGQFTVYTTHDGLPGNAIYGILEDDRGRLWFSTNNGIGCFDPHTDFCKNYTRQDGLQSDEFNGGAFFKSRGGEMFFGGIEGFNAFYPEQITDNPHIPPIVITSFRKLNREVRFDRPLSEVEEITLSHRDYYFSFEFAALDFTAPGKNRYAYKLEGLDKEWITTPAQKRYAQYTTLPPGEYVFRVKGSNNDGVWNEEGAAVAITIMPPYWKSWWFRMVLIAAVGAGILIAYRRRLRIIRLQAELRAAHDMQMAIMPQQDPELPGYDISGKCIPANEVGGDFLDYVWMENGHHHFAILIGDVSGKAMRAAMTAVMASGIVYAETRGGRCASEILSRSNALLYPRTDRRSFTALCLVILHPQSREMRFTNAGLLEPLLKSGDQLQMLKSAGSPHPLGLLPESRYEETIVQLKPGDVLILQTDGLLDTMNHSQHFYGEERLHQLLREMDMALMSARDIRDAILADVQSFCGTAHRFDDMTVIVVKVL